LIDDGYDVVGFDRAGAPDDGPDCICGDLRSADDRNRVVEETNARPGPLVGMVNAAGVSPYVGPLVEIPSSRWELTYDVNVTGLFELTRDCLPLFNNGGSIVNVVSSAGTHGLPGFAGYAAAKEGIRGLTKVAANEWGPQEIRVNAISPQATSPSSEAYFDAHPERRAAKLAQRPIKRDGDAEHDIGRTVVFLVGPDSRFITGVTLMVNGGLTIMP